MGKILLIDDCEEFAETIAVMLETEGYQVTVAPDADYAVEIAQKQDFDVVLCDLVMPIEAGEECAIVGVSTISKIANACPRVPIIAMSGELTGAPLSEIRQFGAREVLSKPFEREQLLCKVKNLLQVAH